ncbi:Transcriptional regulator ure2 [Diplodia seriata]
MQPLVLYSHGITPNPIKVAIILEELELPYECKIIDMKTELKAEPFISVNPNGRLPALEDPNTGVKLFESGAIIEYLVATYDKENKLHHTTSPEQWLEKSWLHFQMSGQGPYFGQRVWFMKYHPEVGRTTNPPLLGQIPLTKQKQKVPSAVERYGNEIKRVTGVIDAHLKKQGTPYLLGDNISYADLVWVPWQSFYPMFGFDDWDWKTEHPSFAAWNERLAERPAVKKVYAKEEFQMH